MALDKKVKKIKLRFIPILVLLTIITYFYIGIFQLGHWLNFNHIQSSLTVFDYILWFFITFYLSLTIHELGHFFSFVFQKVKLRALYITIFVFHKTLKGWRFRIKPKLIVLLGGLVVPDFGDIKNDEEYSKVVNQFSKALIAAPIVTVFLLVTSMITFILSIIMIPNTPWIAISFLIMLFAIPINLLFIYSFTLSNPMFYGDFVAYKKIKTDPIFALSMIIQYSMFTLIDSEESDHFLWEKSRKILNDIQINSSQFHTMILLNYIDGVIRREERFDQVIDIKINRIPIKRYLKNEQGLNLVYDIACYHYVNGNVERAYKLYDEIQKHVNDKLDEKMLKYYKNKYMHILNIEYQDHFLSNQDNYYIGNNWIFDILVDPYEMLRAHHEKLPFREYSTQVRFEEVEVIDNEEQNDCN
jgi:hypothetical protein